MASGMELPERLTQGLQILASSATIPGDSFNNITEAVFTNLLSNDSSQTPLEDIIKKENVDRATVKESYGALAVFIVEAAKYDLSVSNLNSLLEECRMASDRSTYIIDKFQKHKNALRVKLGNIGNALPHVVDVDWRLDYCIKSDLIEKINEPTYLINLKTQKKGETGLENVQFTCTMEQLQDLVGKLKEAVKCIERTSQM